MGSTLLQWRSAIGSHNNFIKFKEYLLLYVPCANHRNKLLYKLKLIRPLSRVKVLVMCYDIEMQEVTSLMIVYHSSI